LVSVSDLANQKRANPPKGIMDAIRQNVTGCSSQLKPCAVCIPPGANLTIHNVPESIQNELGVGSTEEVTFDQLNATANTYRDAFRFRNGQALLIQRFKENVQIRLNSLAEATEIVPFKEGAFVAR
jgi:hypothetical protein